MLHVQTSTGTRLLLGVLYVKRLTAAEGDALTTAGLAPKTVTVDELKALISAVNAGTGIPSTTTPVYTAPLTVQGASEEFITNTMGQVVANTNQNAAQLNGSIFTARDQMKVHVTNEANRIIASA